jgi:hypothetical protein
MPLRVLFAATVAALALAGSASAGPAPAPLDTSSHSLLVPVHGCHPGWKYGWVPQWGVKVYHKHVQPNCWPKVKSGGWSGVPYGWKPGPYAPGCIKFGPVWYCP